MSDWLDVTPGEPLNVRLRPAPLGDVEVPDDGAAALRTAGTIAARKALAPGRPCGLLHHIECARTAPARIKRIAALVHDPAGGAT